MKYLFFLLGIVIILSCNNTNTKPLENKSTVTAKPTETAQPKPANAALMQRVIVDNPENATVSIRLKTGKWFETTEKYAETMIEPLESFRVYIDGNKYNDPTIADTDNILINVTKQKYYFEEIVYQNGQIAPNGPFKASEKTIQLQNGKTVKGHFRPAQGSTIVTGFDYGPGDAAPQKLDNQSDNPSVSKYQAVSTIDLLKRSN